MPLREKCEIDARIRLHVPNQHIPGARLPQPHKRPVMLTQNSIHVIVHRQHNHSGRTGAHRHSFAHPQEPIMRKLRLGLTSRKPRNPQALIVMELPQQFVRIVRSHRSIPLLAGPY